MLPPPLQYSMKAGSGQGAQQYGKMRIDDGSVARAIPAALDLRRERKSKMMYGNSYSKKIRRGLSQHI